MPPRESMHYFGERRRSPADDAQLLGQPADVLGARDGRRRGRSRRARATYERPHAAQWGMFLRTHDELDLGRLTERQRESVFAAFAPAKRMQLYDRGIRRRLAPMLNNDRRRIELANSLMFTLPGTPVSAMATRSAWATTSTCPSVTPPARRCSGRRIATAASRPGRRPIRRVIDDPIYGYKSVNVADQRRDPNSLLNWTERIIRTRKECAEIGWGDWTILDRVPDSVLAIRYDWNDRSTIVLHNFADAPQAVQPPRGGPEGQGPHQSARAGTQRGGRTGPAHARARGIRLSVAARRGHGAADRRRARLASRALIDRPTFGLSRGLQ